jgi:lysozyme family protein
LLAGIDYIARAQPQYEHVARATGIPWYIIGVLHHLEAGLNFDLHLHNGDPLTDRTVRVPVGRPQTDEPPFSWNDSAIDALGLQWSDDVAWDDLGAVLDRIERYNGLGYRSRGYSSPYLWAGTGAYSRGSFVASGVFDPVAVVIRPGAVAILRRLHERGIVQLNE